MIKWLLAIFTLFYVRVSYGQTSWKEAQKTKKATIKVYHVDARPFIYKEGEETKGLEADIMQEFARFLKKEYSIEANVSFHYLPDFGELYQLVKGGYPGTFAASSFSITEARKKEIQFSPAYMPDIEVLISSKDLPILKDEDEVAQNFQGVTGVTVSRSTVSSNLKKLTRFLPDLQYEEVASFHQMAATVSKKQKSIAYVQLTDYLLALKEGLKIKRQNLFQVNKVGRAIVMPKASDWKEPISHFFNAPQFKRWVNGLIKKHFGNDVKDLVWKVSNEDDSNNQSILLLTKEKELKELEMAQKEAAASFQRNILIGVVALVFLTAFFIYSRYQLQQKNNKILKQKNDEILDQRNELVSKNEELQLQQEEILSQQSYIEKKNTELERKNKEVENSIQAAQVFQKALLPFQERMQKHLHEHFVIYKPKDIVSGDFYWVQKRDDKIFMAAVDCTGHGVPGAMMAMVGYMILDRLVMVDQLNDPAEILNRCHAAVMNLLKGNSNTGNYGMDLAFLVIESLDDEKSKITFAGAKRPLWYMSAEGNSIQEAQGTRKSIGGFHRYKFHFSSQDITLEKGSMVYLTTDGFIDQNNSNRKKYGKQRFKDLLRNTAKLPVEEQKEALENELEEHMFGTTQRDDILVIGFKI
ncbi:hypothetical protein BKI52_13605 [marine bacterium AO1-C]|nr:hypothetical protein BKI52_13605 [marine bacterium AO1-C]